VTATPIVGVKNILPLILLASAAFAADEATVPSAKAACGPDNARFKVKAIQGQRPAAQPQTGKALVYVVEDHIRKPGDIGKPTIRVGVDGSWIGANRSTSYLFFAVDPGEHHLCTDWQSAPGWIGPKVSLTSFTADAGKVYYFRARVVVGGTTPTLDLEPINSDEGQLLITNSPLSEYRRKK